MRPAPRVALPPDSSLRVGDAYRRGADYRGDNPVVTAMTVVGTALILAVAVRSRRQLVRVSAPDALEQLLITGSR